MIEIKRKASFTITRPRNLHDEKDYVTLELIDDTSRRVVTKIFVELHDFAQALFGLAYQNCEYEIRSDPSLWGKRKERKQIVLPSPKSYDRSAQRRELKEAAKSYEVDGWTADVDGALNSQHPSAVTFSRYVDVENTE
jgi:hypothetical protein